MQNFQTLLIRVYFIFTSMTLKLSYHTMSQIKYYLSLSTTHSKLRILKVTLNVSFQFHLSHSEQYVWKWNSSNWSDLNTPWLKSSKVMNSEQYVWKWNSSNWSDLNTPWLKSSKVMNSEQYVWKWNSSNWSDLNTPWLKSSKVMRRTTLTSINISLCLICSLKLLFSRLRSLIFLFKFSKSWKKKNNSTWYFLITS